VQRKSKLTGEDFIHLMVFGEGDLKQTSLVGLCQNYSFRTGQFLSKQSLDERFNKHSVLYLKSLLTTVLKSHLGVNNYYKNVLPCCKTIRIKDSSSIQLPEQLKDVYPGSGGKTSKACLKIQFEYDLKTGNILDLSITPFTQSDLSDSYKTVDFINPSDLIIRDLGYISLTLLKQIHHAEAFYLNRIKSNVSIWIDDDNDGYCAVDLYALEKQMRQNNLKTKELTVYLGEKKDVKCRLIIECVPEDIKKEKLRKAHRAAQREGRKLGKQSISRIGLNLFVTNLPTQALPVDQVWYLYRLRWQIELIFKAWKSVASIDKIKKAKRERIESHLYGKLLWALLGWNTYWKLISLNNNNDQIISYAKMMKCLKKFTILIISKSIQGEELKLLESIEFLLQFIIRNCKLEKRKYSTSSLDIINCLSIQ